MEKRVWFIYKNVFSNWILWLAKQWIPNFNMSTEMTPERFLAEKHPGPWISIAKTSGFCCTWRSLFSVCFWVECLFVRSNMGLIRSKKHSPFRVVAPYSVYDEIKLKRNSFGQIVHFYWYLVCGGYASNSVLIFFCTREGLHFDLSANQDKAGSLDAKNCNWN